MHDGHQISVAIETSCRQGGLAIGVDGALAGTVDFDASARHATILVAQLAALLKGREIAPAQLDELYVSAGPGSFTGLRVGITVARTLGQQLPGLKCVAVPTALAVATSAADLDWQHLAVVMDAKEELIYAAIFERQAGRIVPARAPAVVKASEFLASAPRPIVLAGEGLAYHDLQGEQASKLWPGDPKRHLPTAAGVWAAGRELAAQGQFVDYAHLLPIYARASEAQRLWESKNARR